MSDKLVIEFFQQDGNRANPVAAVMSLHGGDNPVSAALTISDFLASIRTSSPAQNFDAYTLASLFILWSATKGPSRSQFPCMEAELIPISTKYGYQAMRIFAGRERTRVELVRDEFTSDEEIIEGRRFLEQLSAF